MKLLLNFSLVTSGSVTVELIVAAIAVAIGF